MTTIKASCPDCDVTLELGPKDVTLHVCSNDTSRSYYAFPCDCCGQRKAKPADDHVVSLLLSGGIRAQVWTAPVQHDGPDLTYDDLLDFVLHLGTTDLLAAAVSA